MALAEPGRGADDFREKSFGGGVAVQNVVLAAFLIIDDELQRDARAIRPVGERRRAAIAGKVARIGFFGHGSIDSPISRS
jgi:hypothetical protein